MKLRQGEMAAAKMPMPRMYCRCDSSELAEVMLQVEKPAK